MSDLVKSQWRFQKKVTHATRLLEVLGIEFRKVKGEGFWEANKAILPELYRELQSEGRRRLAELHPDKGGNADEFKNFIQVYTSVKKAFAWYLPELKNPEQSPTLKIRALKNQRRAIQARRLRLRDPEKYRAYRRALYARHKAEGRLWVRKNKPNRSPESKARGAERSRKWLKDHPERVRELRRKYYWKHKGSKIRKHYIGQRDIHGTPAWVRRQEWRRKHAAYASKRQRNGNGEGVKEITDAACCLG